MYSIDQIRKGVRWGLDSPSLFVRELNRLYHSRRSGPEYNRAGVDIFDEEWDTLVVLDACRYDTFRAVNWLPGRLESRVSRAAHTSEFLRGNFDGRSVTDTVYTTASPQLANRRDEIDVRFHAVENVWNSDRWDEAENTVRPESMTEAAVEMHRRYPHKRHVVHYMQPHYPFIGSAIDDGARGFVEGEGFDFWAQRMRGRIDPPPEAVRTAYRRNLRLALEAVEELCAAVDGLVVITSDHGNMIGDRATPIPIREWGHPPGLYTDPLVTVPWLVRDQGDRRAVSTASPVDEAAAVDEAVLRGRLRDLGYVKG
jgi:hypothetical protein